MEKNKIINSKNNVEQVQKENIEMHSDRRFTWKKLGRFLSIVLETAKKHPVLFWIMIFATTLDGIVAVILPLVASNITSILLHPENSNVDPSGQYFLGMYMHWYSWIYVSLVIFALLIVFEYLTDYSIGMFSTRVEIEQRQKILISLVDQDVDFFFDHVSGTILSRLVADTQGLSLGIQQFLTNIIYCSGMFISATVILFVKDFTLIGIISLAYIFIVLLVGTFIFIKFRKRLIIAFDIKRDIDTDMTDRVSNISLIKSSGTEMYEIDRNAEKNEKYNLAGNKVVLNSSLLNLWVSVTVTFLSTLITIIAVVEAMVSSNPNSANIFNKLILALPLISSMGVPIVLIVQTLRAAARAANSADRISELTEPKPTILPNVNGYKVEKINSITFDNLSFAYPKKPDRIIIPNMNFTFEKGKSYAFVGETGSGKSTIGRLLLRYYDPVKGKILVNGKHDLKKINLPDYLDKVGYVEQDPQIFFGNFYDNIRYSRFDATDDEIIEAAKKADLHEFILSLPEGYNTILGQRGFLLSGGQKQRLVISRVFLKNPDLIILDEATSALDNIVEKEIQKQLDQLVVGKTSITIAHRLSTIKDVDQIIVLGANGKGIVQTGTFDELIKIDGHFKLLYEAGSMN